VQRIGEIAEQDEKEAIWAEIRAHHGVLAFVSPFSF